MSLRLAHATQENIKPLADYESARGGANHPHKHKTISALLV